MFKRVKDWFEKNKSVFLICIIVFGVTFYYTPYFMNKPVAGEFEGSIQNKLVWSVKGECYFVRPLNQTSHCEFGWKLSIHTEIQHFTYINLQYRKTDYLSHWCFQYGWCTEGIVL